MPLLLAGIATLVFVISRLTPADPLVSIVGERNLNNPEVVAAAKAQWGLDQSVLGAVRQVHEEPAARRHGNLVHDSPAGHLGPARSPSGHPGAGDLRADPRRAVGVSARRTRGPTAQHLHRRRSPGSSPCSVRRCRRSGPAWCCCTSSTPDSAGSRGRGGSTRVTLPRRGSPASTRSTRCSTATSARSATRCDI